MGSKHRMIYYSRSLDLPKIIELSTSIVEEEKKYLYENVNFLISITNFHYNVIKGNCLIFKNKEDEIIGFVCFELINDGIHVSNLYIDPNKRRDSKEVLLEMLSQLKMYLRPIYFTVHFKNIRMQKIAKFIKAEVVSSKNNSIKYVIHI